MPTVRGKLWEVPEQIDIPEDFLERIPTKTVIDSLKILKQRYDGEVALVGKTMGPWTLAYHTFGLEPFLISTIDNPSRVQQILSKLMEVTVMFGQAQIDAGADCLTLPDHLTGDLCRAETYRDFLLPVHQQIRQRLNCPIILHICGYTLDRLDYITQTGFDAFHFDSKNDAKETVKIANGRISLIGNINNPQTLLSGNAQQIEKEISYALEAGVDVISPECAVPLNMSYRSLQLVAELAKRHSIH
jgi:[methyl-Co(III) methanol-specific corrinoid protein]:coenzyme M methyltransferase